MKPYRTIPITECGENLCAIPAADFILTSPHPYLALGAPQEGDTPWLLRSGILTALQTAKTALEQRHPAYKFRIFDSYRPNSVQNFMVAREFSLVSGGRTVNDVPEPECSALWELVYRLWAAPSLDPATPPPHSTGAALDLTIATADGQDIEMGSPIDENSDRSNPDYFITSNPTAHANRQLLLEVMHSGGFVRHATEWWHFSLGDQMWAWEQRQIGNNHAIARYGRADLLPSAKNGS